VKWEEDENQANLRTKKLYWKIIYILRTYLKDSPFKRFYIEESGDQ
jgi:hypothetical protein